MAYEKKEFIVYSATKSSFQSLVNSGGITNSQIGIISETSEFWAKGQYYPLVNLGEYLKKDDAVEFAKDLEGKLETTQEEFTFRASAGNKSIKDSSAVIRRIKGNSIVWQQLVSNGDFSNGSSGWRTLNSTMTMYSDRMRLTNTSSTGCGAQTTLVYPIKSGSKVAVIIDYKRSTSSSARCSIEFQNSNASTVSQHILSTTSSSSRRVDMTVVTTSTDAAFLKVYPLYNGASGTYCDIYSVQVFNLTLMFGAGSEPDIKRFKELFPNSYYLTSRPLLVGMNTIGIRTIGFNCFNKDAASYGYISSSTGGIGSSSLYMVSAPMHVLPGTEYFLKDVRGGGSTLAYALYDSFGRVIKTGGFSNNGTNASSGIVQIPYNASTIRVVVHSSFVNTCCVNIRHSAVNDGYYEPYEEHSRDLPEINRLFPQGMHRIGEHFDEITSEYAIRRIAVRNYISGDANSSRMFTDGATTTIVVLAEPEKIKLIDPIQLDYMVHDWGTEMVVGNDGYAPFSADIVYRFNAEGRIRDNARNIERLEAKVNSAISAPYILKSVTALDFANADGGDLQLDFDSDDLQGGEISRALESCRPIYIRAGSEEDWFRGITPMRWIYEEDLIYGSFTNPIDNMEYNLEIGGQYISFTKTIAIPAQPNWNETNEDSISYICNKPDTTIPVKRVRVSNLDSVDELIPGYLYEQTSVLATNTVHGLTDDYEGGANFWMVRIPMTRNGSVINFDDTILWANGAPTYSFSSTTGNYGIFEITLKRDLTGHVLGEWKFFK
jgi:hypothetical protein